MKIPKHLRFFVTDVDGVIIDRMPQYAEIFCELVAPFGINHADAHSYYFGTAGTPVDDQFPGVLHHHSIVFDPSLIQVLRGRFFDRASHAPAPLFPDAFEALNIISDGMDVCATSGANTAELAQFKKKYSLPFAYFLGSDVMKKGTIHIEHFASCYRIQRATFARQSVFLGDGPRDMEIARENGIFAIGITNTVSEDTLRKSGANAIITKISDVLPLLGIERMK